MSFGSVIRYSSAPGLPQILLRSSTITLWVRIPILKRYDPHDSLMHFTAPYSQVPHSAEEARAFWYSLINYEHNSPTPDDFKLDPMRG
jgi:hypothetical protein